jgi:amidohydrolase
MILNWNDVDQLIHESLPELVHIRRHVHQNPELAHEESKTTELVENALRQHGIIRISKPLNTGLWADIGSKEGPILVLRADIDAVPIQEENNCPYHSLRRGVMHASGHDGHVAILLGVAFALKAVEAYLPSTVRLIFQPAEETGTGALKMIEAGALSEPGTSEVLAVHLWPSLRQGQIATRPGAIMAGNDRLRIQVKGRGGHGAVPYKAIDAIVIAAQVILALQTVVSRQSDPLKPVVLSIGTVQAGTSPFAIAETVEMTGTLRTFDLMVREKTLAQIERIVHQVTSAFGGEGKLEVARGSSPVINAAQCVERAKRAVATTGAGDFIVLEEPAMVTEDFSRYLVHKPGALILIGVDRPGGGEAEPLYSPHFDFDEAALIPAIRTLLGVVADFCNFNGKRPDGSGK